MIVIVNNTIRVVYIISTCFTGKPPVDDVTPRDFRYGFLGGQHVISLIKSKGCLRKHIVLHKLVHILSVGHKKAFGN